MIVILDNYDSFTYNLYQYVGEINPDVVVIRNDQITVNDLSKMPYRHLIISPGPGYPQTAGITVEAIKTLSEKAPILGICLGHQSIGYAFGADIVHAPKLVHGKVSEIKLGDSPIFEGIVPVIKAARYHSLIVKKNTLPDTLKVIAKTKDGEIMGVEHKSLPIFGLQFHPESILTPDGKQMLKNFLRLYIGEKRC